MTLNWDVKEQLDAARSWQVRPVKLAKIAKSFGISESSLQCWPALADIEDGTRPGVTASESAELRELRRRNRQLEQAVEILRQRDLIWPTT